MALDHIPIDDIAEQNLLDLKENQVSEGKEIEYKLTLPGKSDGEKKEFLADVSSFANAGGGHIVYGIKEEEGIPTEIVGLADIDADAEVLRLDSLVRDSIAPRLPGFHIKAVGLESGNVAIVLRIARSWSLPHMVTLSNSSRFFSRASAGKYQLDVGQIRSLFSLSETGAERIRNFRMERLSNIVSGQTPVTLGDEAKVVFHIVPFSLSDPTIIFDISDMEGHGIDFEPMNRSMHRCRHNFDGYLSFDPGAQDRVPTSYLQIFRNGAIEAVDSDMLAPDRPQWKSESTPDVMYHISSNILEQELMLALPRYLKIQRHLGVDPPFILMLSLIGVKGYTMYLPANKIKAGIGSPIDRDTLIVPEVIVEDYSYGSIGEVMEPMFDAVWNAAGFPKRIKI